jgi:hypothetical protein
MGRLLARWIYPHFHNDHHPYAIRHQFLFFFVILLTIIQLGVNAYSGELKILGYATNITKNEVINLTNKERQILGKPSLKESSVLNKAATLKANDMFSDNYWAHFAPDGTSPWYFYGRVGYSYTWAGENLARDFQTSAGVVAGWMSSTAGHKENILNSNFTEVGVAVKNGVLQGEETTLVVQLFGKPVSYTASAPAGGTSPSGTSGLGGTEVKVEDKLLFPADKAKLSEAGREEIVTSASDGVMGEAKNSLNIAGMLENLSSSQKTSFGLLFILGSLFTIDSIAIFRRRHRRLNSHSGMHASVVFTLMLALLAQSLGSVL